MKRFSTLQLVIIFAPFVFSFAFGLDIYIPIIPQMTELFNTTPALVQLTMSLFLFCTGVGQLFIGPLSDQWGRRPVFYWSSACYAVGSLACALSPNIFCLIGARLISSLGACGMLVTSFATVRDLFSSHQSGKMYSFLNGAIGISPTFAPIIGGYLSLYLGWPSVFVFLGLIGVSAWFITKIFIEETHEPAARIKIDKKLLGRYWHIFSNREFLIYSTLAGCAEGVFFGFFSTSPFIIIHKLGIPAHEFGYYFAIFGSALALGGLFSGQIITKIGNLANTFLGIALMALGGLTMLAWHFWAGLSLLGFLLPMVIACVGAMFLLGSSAAAALEPFGSIAGTASAALGAMEFGLSALIGSILMLFPVNSTLPYGLSIVFLAVLCWWLLQYRKNRFNEDEEQLGPSTIAPVGR